MKPETEEKIKMCLERIVNRVITLRGESDITMMSRTQVDAIEFYVEQIKLAMEEEKE